ncbi:MAG: hypothetical protein J4400_03920 [Candidatus Aenigmarchaeota archaeon]|nr:hypothetical protein [Candidatus Aenigmarchaeota archaeon]
MSYIRILEFGSQTTDRIGTRFEQMGVPVKYGPSNMRAPDLTDASGVVLSGGPKGAKDPNAYPYDPEIFSIQRPILGICYGHQLGARYFGAELHRRTKEYGETNVDIISHDPLLDGFGNRFRGWMNHGDSITQGDFSTLGYTEKGVPAIIRRGNFFAVQYHPEVSHTENGRLLLRNFAGECGITTRDVGFGVDTFIKEAMLKLKEDVGNNTILAYVSGGVDSTVAVMLAKQLGLDIVPVYIETGFGRKDEARFAYENVSRLLGQELYVHDESERFLAGLSGIHDSEAKRKAFQRMYNETRARIERRFDISDTILFDGSLVTDYRESGKETGTTNAGATVDKIKTHHNSDDWEGRKIAPLSGLTKEQTRMVARHIGLPASISERVPFPGPGLSVRFPTAYYEVPQELFQSAEEAALLYGMHAFVLPRKGVGLKGDSRVLEHVAVISGERDWSNIRRTSKHLIEELPICRVIYMADELHDRGMRPTDGDFNKALNYPLTRENLDRLREVTDVMETTTADFGVHYSQMPVFSFGGPYGWINVGRDVDSEDFRTCRPLRRPDEFPWECCDEIERRLKERLGDESGMTAFEVSDKPGGTTELE